MKFQYMNTTRPQMSYFGTNWVGSHIFQVIILLRDVERPSDIMSHYQYESYEIIRHAMTKQKQKQRKVKRYRVPCPIPVFLGKDNRNRDYFQLKYQDHILQEIVSGSRGNTDRTETGDRGSKDETGSGGEDVLEK